MSDRREQPKCSHPLWLALLLTAACADPPTSLGAVCTHDRACSEGICAADHEHVPNDLEDFALRCAAPLGRGKLGDPCQRGSDCAHGLCALAGACVVACETDAECERGQLCSELFARATEATFGKLHACVALANLPDDARVQSEVHQGALHAGIDTITLPPTAAPTLFVLQHLDDHSWPIPVATSSCRPPLCARSLRHADPNDGTLFELATLDTLPDGPDNPIASGSHVDPLTVLIPNGPRAALDPGGYALEVESKQPGALRLTTLTRSERGQQLDLNLYYVGARDLNASAPRGSELLAAALEEVDRVLGQADIFLGELRQIEVRGALLDQGVPLQGGAVSRGLKRLISQYQVLPQLPELFKLSAGAGNVALNVFFVADIDSRGGDVGGITGSTPLALGMHGTTGSGIVIAADMFSSAGDPRKLGRTLAHEFGHALGLFHTTEIDGLVFDPLPDTPVCPKTRDLDKNTLLDAHECAADGGDNLMFPTSDATDTKLTPQQIEVLRGAMILH